MILYGEENIIAGLSVLASKGSFCDNIPNCNFGKVCADMEEFWNPFSR